MNPLRLLSLSNNYPIFGQWQLLQVGALVFGHFLAIVQQDIPWVHSDTFNSKSGLHCYYLTSLSYMGIPFHLRIQALGDQKTTELDYQLLFTLSCIVYTTVSVKSPILPPAILFKKLKNCLHIPLHFQQLHFINMFRYIFNT